MEPSGKPSRSDVPTRHARYVLVAEPDARRAAMFTEIARSLGLDVVATRNGDEAKATLRRRQAPLLVVTNLSLPRLDGFALLADLRRLAGADSPPVLVVSSSKELSGAAWNLKERLGVTEILPADATPEQAEDAVRRVLPELQGGPSQGPGGPLPNRWTAETIDRYAAEVAERLGISLVVVAVAVGSEEWLRAHVNLPRRPTSARVSPRTWTFIRQVVEGREPIVVPDVTAHPVFGQAEFPPPGTLRGYVGIPVSTDNEHVSGAMCLFDSEPLSLDARAMDGLIETARRLALELDAGMERVQSYERVSELSRLALTDKVTGLANRRGGEEALAREVARARRTAAPLSLVLFDIDHFKSINDRSGHATGDRVLKGVSEILSASQRGSDLAMRWGGEEFLVLLPDVGLAGARVFAERVRENVQNLAIEGAGRISVSGGVAELGPDEDPTLTLQRADENLYRAKTAGRNRIVTEAPD